MRILATLALTLTALPAFAGTFHYRVSDYPAAGDCHQLAAELGARFERVTHVTPDTALCTDITSTAFAFEVTYTADEPLNDVSTVRQMSLGQEGVYQTLAACEAVRASETAHFQEVTGLEAVASYCKIWDIHDEPSYELKIDSFGTPAMEPFHSETAIFDVPVDTPLDVFQKAIFDALAQRGLDVRHAVLRSDGIYATLDVLYYATAKFDLSAPELSSLDSKEQCLEQLGLAQAARRGRSEAPVALYCGRSMISTYYVIGIYRDLGEPSDQLSAERFANYTQCKGQRDALVDAYNQRMGGRVTAGLCTKDEELVWRVRLLLH